MKILVPASTVPVPYLQYLTADVFFTIKEILKTNHNFQLIILTPQVNGKKKKTKLAVVSEIKEKFPILSDALSKNRTARLGLAKK